MARVAFTTCPTARAKAKSRRRSPSTRRRASAGRYRSSTSTTGPRACRRSKSASTSSESSARSKAMRLARWCFVCLLLCVPVRAQEAKPVSFRQEIAPLLNRRRAACHNEETAKGRYRVDSFARLLKPGESDENPVVAGHPDDSELFRLL